MRRNNLQTVGTRNYSGEGIVRARSNTWINMVVSLYREAHP